LLIEVYYSINRKNQEAKGGKMQTVKKSPIRLAITIVCIVLLMNAGCIESDSDDDNNTPSGTSNSQCSAEMLEDKPVDFHNTWQPDVTVSVYQYDLACPDAVFLNPSDVAFSLGSPGYDPDAHLLLPQGEYSMCIDWWDGNDSTYYYRIYGELPDDPFFALNENSNETVPLEMSVEAGYPVDGVGRCPGAVDISETGGDNNGSSDVYLIGNHGELAVYNPTEQQIADADITLSGSLSSLFIYWKLQNVISVVVSGTGSTVYGIVGASDGMGGEYTIASPVKYGDYTVANTEIAVSQSPAPALIAGEDYNVSVATSDGKTAYIGFSISN
jgi:hypothetical protein